MPNVSIFEKSWTDIVFEGRNKSYGAYQLRNENPKTTITALFLGFLSLVSFAGIVMLLSSFDKGNPTVTPDNPDKVIEVTNIFPPSKPLTDVAAASNDEKEDDEIEKKDLDDPIIVDSNNADEIKTNTESRDNSTTENPGTTGTTGTTGTEGGTGSTSATTGSVIPNTGSTDGPVAPSELDVMPEFPGGIEKFYAYIGNNFEKPESREAATMTVLMTFVVEKNGEMTDIRVVRSARRDLDKEAIRVLKSLKKKWTPGKKDGQPMRTQYLLPITVNLK